MRNRGGKEPLRLDDRELENALRQERWERGTERYELFAAVAALGILTAYRMVDNPTAGPVGGGGRALAGVPIPPARGSYASRASS